MAGRLQGKVAIITGGNSGIGEATAHRFAQEGAQVAILARRAQEREAVQQAIRAAGGAATFIPCDVTNRTLVDAAVARTLDTYGALHVLFNNAGGASRDVLPEESDIELKAHGDGLAVESCAQGTDPRVDRFRTVIEDQKLPSLSASGLYADIVFGIRPVEANEGGKILWRHTLHISPPRVC